MNKPQTLDQLIAAAPDATPEPVTPTVPTRDLRASTGFPARYRPEWPRPQDGEWNGQFVSAKTKVEVGGLLALIGARGVGKTRLAAEVARDLFPKAAYYSTVMGVFLRLRQSFHATGRGAESEADVVHGMAIAPLLILDEVQERGNSEWEDRILTHIVDRRYGDCLPTILIANLTQAALAANLGESILSRFHETGGVLEMTGPSKRIK